MTKTIDPQVYELAESVLFDAPLAFIESLASSLQATCDDAAAEYEDWLEEQKSLKGYTDEEKARI